jgi:hypothetical protein
MKQASKLLAMLLVSPMTVGPARAQAPLPMVQDTTVIELQLRKESPIEKGQVAVVQGTTSSKGLRFRLNSLSVLQPVIAAVLARDEQADLRMSLLKPGLQAPNLSASTRGEGSATLSTRTQGGLDALIDGPSGTPFTLMLWVSDELTPRLAGVVVRPDEYRAWSARHPLAPQAVASTSMRTPTSQADQAQSLASWWVLAAFLAAAAIVLVSILVLRRKHVSEL